MSSKTKIAFLTVDFLGNKSFSINYYIGVLLSYCKSCFEGDEFSIYTHKGSEGAEYTFEEIMADFRISDYPEDVKVVSTDCYDFSEAELQQLSDCDLIVSTIYFWGDVLEQLKTRYPGTQVIYWLPSILWHEYMIVKQSKWYKYDLALAEQKKSIENADHVIFNSASDAFYGERYFGSAIKRHSAIYPLPFVNEEPKIYAPAQAREKTVFGFAGRWEYRKGIQFLVESFFRYFAMHQNSQLRILSHIPEDEELDVVMEPQTVRKFKALSKIGAIEVLPWQKERKRYIDFLKGCDVMVLPSLYDPFNIIGYDCVALHVPLVLSRFCGIEEIVTECESLIKVNPLDVDELYLAMKTAAQAVKSGNDSLNLPRVSRSLDDVVAQTFDVYRSLLNDNVKLELVN
ncbi:glycosyltransferase family 4 protein [Exilibacterium tricleocarpae]|uniref:Glycosyltransferase family 4 protein n=1 Tax=Exilibacterium tricleocarpae TaxID=2591008 RepID=A0A545TS93_9GAMM|nr:glycosyltransferase family 4 protein [Exilibacterium tricleocarpae]TQV80086.1 glycosyltransferase family 4 protein [Exilibacterium tricleocarpae]